MARLVHKFFSVRYMQKKGVNDRVDVIVCILVSSQVSRHQLRSLCSMRHSSHFEFTKYHTAAPPPSDCGAPYMHEKRQHGKCLQKYSVLLAGDAIHQANSAYIGG